MSSSIIVTGANRLDVTVVRDVANPFSLDDEREFVLPTPQGQKTLSGTDLLLNPRAHVRRLIDSAKAQSETRRLAVTFVVACAVVGCTICRVSSLGAVVQTGFLSVVFYMGALAAALGPIYAMSMTSGSRVPLRILAPLVLSAHASGGVALLCTLPLTVIAIELDASWVGPLAVVGSLAVGALFSAHRIHRLLKIAAELQSGCGLRDMPERGASRVAFVGRVSFLICTLTLFVASVAVLGR